MAGSIRQSKRIRVWMTLVLLLVAAVVALVLAIQSRDDDSPRTSAKVVVVDEAGVPMKDAVIVVRKPTGDDPHPLTVWDPQKGTLSLASQDAGASVFVGAKGYRVRRLDDVRSNQTVVLDRGYTVRIDVGGDAPAVEPPFVGLLFVHPDDATSRLGEDEGGKPMHLGTLMEAIERGRPELPELPAEKFGFSVTTDDAKKGFRVPTPGTYTVVWALLHESPYTWSTHVDPPTVTIEVEDTSEPQTFELEVDKNRAEQTRVGLIAKVETVRGGG